MIEQEQETFTLEELANIHKVSKRTIQRRIDNGTLAVTLVERGRYRLVKVTTNDKKPMSPMTPNKDSEDKEELTQQRFLKIIAELLIKEKSMIEGLVIVLTRLGRNMETEFDFIDEQQRAFDQKIRQLEQKVQELETRQQQQGDK